jgi:hypothetical protein
MIQHSEIKNLETEWGLREDVIEKDYVISWLLWGIGSHPVLRDAWIFKGGTCLKKCYFETYRFSEDLDFTVLPDGPFTPDDVLPILDDVIGRVHEASGLDFTIQPRRMKLRPDGKSSEGRVYYRGPRRAPSPGLIKLDLNAREKLVRPPVLRGVAHAFTDPLPGDGAVRCCRPFRPRPVRISHGHRQSLSMHGVRAFRWNQSVLPERIISASKLTTARKAAREPIAPSNRILCVER